MMKSEIREKYELIYWDFDGVIMNSMEVRDNGFKEVLKDFEGFQVEELLKYHRKNGGLSRYHKFRYFFEKIRGEEIDEQGISSWAEKFSEIMLDQLSDQNLLIKETVGFIEELAKSGIKQFIVSGSDQRELRILCNKVGISDFFQGIYGSPVPKNELVKYSLILESPDLKKVCLIGDSINDYEAAVNNNIDFIGFGNESLKTGSYQYVQSF